MSKAIIEVENISKLYRIGANKERYLSLRDEVVKTVTRLSSGLTGVFTQNRQKSVGAENDFWALNNVSFSVQEGEAVGIIGRNGAGKSTLLKILSQITPPTKGKITMRGRVASLLEVGTGFHPELTGRENIFLNGTILGMSRKEVARKFDEIVAFAEVDKFLDTPVKRYSSGMYVRLAFAVAAHLEPEILVVDEVLAVGDAEFQKKCLGKMSEVAKKGRTVLFVSHNMAAVDALCNRGVVLHYGCIVNTGSIKSCIDSYLKGNESKMVSMADIQGMFINSVRIEDEKRMPREVLEIGESFRIIIELRIDQLVRDLHIGIGINDSFGLRIATCLMKYQNIVISEINRNTKISCIIQKPLMVSGDYDLKIALNIQGEEIEVIDVKKAFSIMRSDFFGTGRLPEKNQGIIVLKHEWETNSDSTIKKYK